MRKFVFISVLLCILASIITFFILWQTKNQTDKTTDSGYIQAQNTRPSLPPPSPTPAWRITNASNCPQQFESSVDNLFSLSLCLSPNLKPTSTDGPIYTFTSNDYMAETISAPNKSEISINKGELLSLSIHLSPQTNDLDTLQSNLRQQEHRITRETVIGTNTLLHTLSGTTTGIALDAHVLENPYLAEFTYHYNPRETPDGEAKFVSIINSLKLNFSSAPSTD